MPLVISLLRPIVIIGSLVYVVGLFAWFAAYSLTGDRFGPLALINSLALYLFLPLALVLVASLLVRRPELWMGIAAGVGLFLWLWGGLFLPRDSSVEAGTPTLTVMTYNTLALHRETGAAIDVIRAEEADVVCIQELNPLLARAIEDELADEYPYQILRPAAGVQGMGTISKHPIRLADEQPPPNGVGPPLAVEVDWNERPVTVVNFHLSSLGGVVPAPLSGNFRQREQALRRWPSTRASPASEGRSSPRVTRTRRA